MTLTPAQRKLLMYCLSRERLALDDSAVALCKGWRSDGERAIGDRDRAKAAEIRELATLIEDAESVTVEAKS